MKKIKENPVMVFAKSSCPFCIATEKRFLGLGAKFEYYTIDQQECKSPLCPLPASFKVADVHLRLYSR